MSKHCKCDKPEEEQRGDLLFADICLTCGLPFPPCNACKGTGFILANLDSRMEIQRCDACDKYAHDDTATIACYEMAREAFNEHDPD